MEFIGIMSRRGLNNFQRHLEVDLRYPILGVYQKPRTMISVSALAFVLPSLQDWCFGVPCLHDEKYPTASPSFRTSGEDFHGSLIEVARGLLLQGGRGVLMHFSHKGLYGDDGKQNGNYYRVRDI